MRDGELVVQGTVAPGFEPVRDLFERNMARLAEQHSQLCVYVDGERVVDLWASAADDAGFSPDALANVFSSTKSFEAIAMAWLYGQGLFDYEAPVADYWPEFAGAGKQATTIADVMRHEAGLAGFSTSIPKAHLRREQIKQNRIGAVIEAHPQKFRDGGPDKRREYHAITRGWIVNEIFRRIDPAGRTIGEFLQDQVAGPLGADVFIGVPDDQLARMVELTTFPAAFYLRESFKPQARRRVEFNAWQALGMVGTFARFLRNSTTRGNPPAIEGLGSARNFCLPDVAQGEVPSANGNCSARGLARVAAAMAGGGRLDGTEVLNQHGWDGLHGAPLAGDMGFITSFSQGGVAQFDIPGAGASAAERRLNDGREGFYGWMGFGGSVFQWHPQKKIGFGYVPTALAVHDLFNERAKAYQAQVLRCLA